MNMEYPVDHKSGYVAILGKPNVGKSSLVNSLLGQKIAAVTSKAQTTRRRQLGILSDAGYQIIFTDTPGIHDSRNKLGNLMNQDAHKALPDADIALLILDSSRSLDDEDLQLIDWVKDQKLSIPLWVVYNKLDVADLLGLERIKKRIFEKLTDIDYFEVSALTGQGLQELKSSLVAALPEGPPFFDPEQVTDLYERQIAADLIREAALNSLRDEVPHGLAVRIDEYIERGETGARIDATLFVERESHKGIVVGESGTKIKEIGTAARKEIERMSGRKIFIKLRVKLRKNWRNDEAVLQRFGY
jgi:GTP-binding protein Era